MRGLLLLLLLAAASSTQAQGMQAKNREVRLDVSGEIGIDPQGAVYDYQIRTILTPEVRQLVDRAVRQWTFEPVVRDGKPVHAKSGMHLTLAALPVDQGYQLRIDGVRFLGGRPVEKMVPPKYPRDATRVGVNATVLVAVHVDATGKVLDAVASRSALVGARATERVAEAWRKRFEASSVAAAKKWQFRPADLAAGDAPEITIIVPITYRMADAPDSMLEGWRAELAGPSHPIPWLSVDKQQFDANGLKEGQSLALDNPMKLQTAVVGKTL